MRFTPLIAMMLVAVSSTQTPVRSDAVVVKAVLDGDTIETNGLGRVRLLGIDAPEIGRGFDTPAPFAREARERLAALVLNRYVRLEQDTESRDVYQRRLAYVFREDGLFINAALLREGLARVSARLPLARLPVLKQAEAEAQSFRRGIWGATPSVPPTTYPAPRPPRKGAARTPHARHRRRKGAR